MKPNSQVHWSNYRSEYRRAVNIRLTQKTNQTNSAERSRLAPHRQTKWSRHQKQATANKTVLQLKLCTNRWPGATSA